MKIFIGSDHRGFKYKEAVKKYLMNDQNEVTDMGPVKLDTNDDYVDYAFKVAKQVQMHPDSKGILLCGSGIGMYIAANKVAGVRAAECRTAVEAKIDREHHDSNILVLAEDLLNLDDVNEIINTWLKTPFAGGRHQRRLKKINMYEEEYIKPFHSTKIVPSILSKSIEEYSKLAENYSKFSNRLHVDVMDGDFVNTKSPELHEIVNALKGMGNSLAYHLMTNDPISKLNTLLDSGNTYLVYMHIEALQGATVNAELPFTLGIALNPETSIADDIDYIKDYSVVLLLSVVPGNYGSEFMPDILSKVNDLRSMGYAGEIHVDGGINLDNLDQVLEYKPDAINIGSAIHNAENPEEMYRKLLSHVK